MEQDQHERGKQDTGTEPAENAAVDFLSAQTRSEPRSWAPWIVASVVVVLALATLVIVGHRTNYGTQPGTTGMAAAAPYAAQLPITGIVMSEASSFSGSKVTYIDGQITNKGNQVIRGITVEVGFRNDLGELAGRSAMPLGLIRTREPYVDTQPVSAAPLKPGDTRDFRLIFDSIPEDWNQQYPEIRVISTVGQ
jgi:hypothetical protein